MRFVQGDIVRSGLRRWVINHVIESQYHVTKLNETPYDAHMPIYWIDENCELDEEYIIDKVLTKYSDG